MVSLIPPLVQMQTMGRARRHGKDLLTGSIGHRYQLPQCPSTLTHSILFRSSSVCYDTQLILKRLSVDEYIAAALALYLDFLNLFLYILRVLNSSQRD